MVCSNPFPNSFLWQGTGIVLPFFFMIWWEPLIRSSFHPAFSNSLTICLPVMLSSSLHLYYNIHYNVCKGKGMTVALQIKNRHHDLGLWCLWLERLRSNAFTTRLRHNLLWIGLISVHNLYHNPWRSVNGEDYHKLSHLPVFIIPGNCVREKQSGSKICKRFGMQDLFFLRRYTVFTIKSASCSL